MTTNREKVNTPPSFIVDLNGVGEGEGLGRKPRSQGKVEGEVTGRRNGCCASAFLGSRSVIGSYEADDLGGQRPSWKLEYVG